uniref:Uncharacterized protein n=1 Tax=Hyaloperonospora arabidopsidis (strain Emoy2) TaxID=559515 RepID=M4BWL7_HYAAE
MLPAYERRTGRISSLHEFQQRAVRYNSNNGNETCANDRTPMSELLRDEHEADALDTYVEVTPTQRDSDGSDSTESFRKYGRRRSASGASLFGGERSRALDKASYYRRQVKAVCFLVLLGVIGGPMNYGIRV